MKYLLDTNIVSWFYDGSVEQHKAVRNKILYLGNDDQLFISSLTLFELEYSYFLASPNKQPEIRQIIDDVKNDFGIFSLKNEMSSLYGEIKALLKKSRPMITTKNMQRHNMDILLASTALHESCILVSADALYPDLKKLEPTLEFQNWLE